MNKHEKIKMASIVRKGMNGEKDINYFDKVLIAKYMFFQDKNKAEQAAELCSLNAYLQEKQRYFQRRDRKDKVEEYGKLINRVNLLLSEYEK